ncbi:MAG: DNA polymerase III subunit gamma/tau [Planctomycetota bacterium]
MTYVVFARKYRPQTFEEVVGQGHVAQTLRNAISGDRLAHAYLFCGPRGVGKTTMARLLAKAVNCLVSPGTHPCGTCEACTSIASGQDVDVLELDAASRRKVEDIEPLIDSSRYLPQRSPKKVFIVDEAHMLSKTAWNALLKTLEEPPPHVLFIFATTEPSKVIETVRSRCQRFDFKRITEIDIAGKLRRIADAEGAQVEEEVFAEIASRATGGMRDAETLLDQSLSAAPEDRALAADDLVAILGGTPRASRGLLLEAALAGDMTTALQGAAELVDAGADPVELLGDLFADVHHRAVSCARGDSDGAFTVEWCLAAADLLSRHRHLARESRAARASLDLGLLAVSRLGDVRDLEELVGRLEALSHGAPATGAPVAVRAPVAPAQPTAVPAPAPARAPQPAPAQAVNSPAVNSPAVNPPAVNPPAVNPPAVNPPAVSPPAPPRLELPKSRPQVVRETPVAPQLEPKPSRPENAPRDQFTADEMREIRSHPKVKEVLDSFRGRIENVKREQQT